MRLGIAVVVASLVAAVPALAGPPWIAIEYPANPFDPASRDAVLLVHAFHHGTEIDNAVSGTAEGLVGGERKSVKLEFKRTSRTGVFALTNQWGQSGDWTLVITTGG